MQDRVFISGYSIDNDLKKIRRMISSYSSLKIVRNKNTIYLVGDEADKRKLYKDLLTEETKGNFMNLNSIADLWENFDLLEVKDILEEVCEMNDYYIRDVSFPMIMIHAGVSIERIINHNYIEDKTYNEKLKDSLEYKVAKDFFSKVSQVIHIPVIEDEVVLFSYLLLGKSGKFYNRNRKESENNAIMHAEIVAINEACGKLKSWRLEGCSLYVTLEPCMMCMGAIIESRIKEVYYGTAFNGVQMYDKNCIKSAISIKNIQNDECSKMLSSFFEKKRKK